MRGSTIETPKEVMPDLNLSAMSKHLLRQLYAGEITQDEFMTECAYWTLKDDFDELRPRPLPSKPAKVLELDNMPVGERGKIDFVKLCESFPQVKQYRDACRSIKNDNQARWDWLEQLLRYIPDGDEQAREQVKDQILKFKYFGVN